MKKLVAGSMAVILFVLSGCFPMFQEEQQDPSIEEAPEEQEVAVVPSIRTADDFYQSILYDGKYPHGESRGFGTDVVSNRLDLDHLEIGLTRVAQEYFNTDNYFFREGQFIGRTEINNWLIRYDEESNPTGLNPALGSGETMKEREESQPRYLSHILEHNYLVEKENGKYEVGGIVIGLSLNSVYNFRVVNDEGKYNLYETTIAQDEILAEGQAIAEEVVARLRSADREEGAFQNIPIVVALFQEQPRDSAIPGNFISQAVAEPNDGLSKWQEINEQFYLFPSTSATKDVRNDTDQFNSLKDEIQSFFETYVGVVGRGFYSNNQLQELTIEIPIQYKGKTEIVALSQFIASEINQRYNDTLKISVYISSVGGNQEALIVRNPNEEPFIHIYQ